MKILKLSFLIIIYFVIAVTIAYYAKELLIDDNNTPVMIIGYIVQGCTAALLIYFSSRLVQKNKS
ncbi:hypothetical protein CWS20_00430 [Cytobacillus horneckiae]|uniref:Uncharacterized protein n=1 Tax=Cytobacillus horneckiae TaxID=549687 RepID=A0A2N0ZN27_9BACI|nr:hypothetical protein CWS20_00430 [Cytobacillus horneckiae]